jgi:hypothetical protein
LQRGALVSFLTVLSKALPGPAAHRGAVQALLARVQGTGSGSAVQTDSEWQAVLSGWRLGAGKGDDLDWTANCDPSKRGGLDPGSGGGAGRHITSGYTCGLWTLFHMLVAGAPRAGLTPGEAMGAVRTYVEHFFGCAQCRDHFLSMHDGCEHGRCDIDAHATPPPPPTFSDVSNLGSLRSGSVGGGSDGVESAWVAAGDAYQTAHDATALWLWRTHNAVSRAPFAGVALKERLCMKENVCASMSLAENESKQGSA